MDKKFYITTAIAYPNSKPHLGHALEIVQADAFARFHKLLGKEVVFQTGTDEHGLKNWQTAKKARKDVKDFLDENVKIFKELYEKLNISYDNFVRTTDKKNHHPGAIKLWKKLVESEDIYKKEYKGKYCDGCEAFKIERELEDGKCPNHPTREISLVEEENYFFRLSKYSKKVEKLIKSDEYKVIPKSRKKEILSFLKDARDISFSRPKTTLPWGIPVPGDEEQVMYVWCDALSNYITGIGYGRDEKKFKKIWPADSHIIGKDILRFHAAFWPAMLLSAGIQLPKELFVHGFILSKGEKMSKSTGNVIEPFEQIEKFGTDPFRFYILGAMPIDGDGEYSEKLLIERFNKEFLGNLSNFSYRILSFINENFDSEIKEVAEDDLIKDINKKIGKIKEKYEDYNFKKAIELILSVSDLGNKYFQEKEPWKLVKEDKEKAEKILGLCLNIVRNLSILIKPVAPEFSSELQKLLNEEELEWKDLSFDFKGKVKKAKILVDKMEEEEKEKEEKFPLDLRVAKVEEVKEHPNADRLIVLNIDLGDEKRQIVAGIKEHYDKEELEGKKIIVVANLEKAKLRGIESQAMLLAGTSKDEKIIGLLTVEESEPGDKVQFGDLENSTEEISFKDFQKINMEVKDKKAYFGDKALKTEKEEVKVEKAPEGAKIR